MIPRHGYRNDFNREHMIDHLKERQWTEEDIERFSSVIGRSALLSPESAMIVLEFQKAVDERIATEQVSD